MRMTWKRGLAVPLACVSLCIGCGKTEERPAGTRRAQATGAGSRQVSLEGCVEAAAGTNSYVLRHVRMAATSAPTSEAQMAPDSGITNGGWVKLRLVDQDQLKDRIGQMVAVTGTIVDDGRSTIGTSGPAYGPDERGPRTDQSQAASSQHHSKKVAQEAGPIAQQSLANGTAPEIALERVSSTGAPCRSGKR